MTDPLPFAVRSAVDAHTGAVDVDPRALLSGAVRRAGRRRRVRGTSAVVAVAVAVTGVAAGASLLPGRDGAPAPVGSVPPGQQAVSWHGVEVLVPASWRLGDTRCGSPQSDTVLRPGGYDACLAPPVPGLTVVEFSAARGRVVQAVEPVDLDGVPALRGTATVDRPTAVFGVRRVLHVPSEGVLVTAQATTAEQADALLATARVVDIDAQGCPSRLASSRPEGPSGRSGTSLLPGTPTAVSLCRYAALRLEESRRLDAAGVPALQQRLDGLATGRAGRIPEREIDAQYCTEIDDDVVLAAASYGRGPDVRVLSRHAACTDRSLTNGSVTRRPDDRTGQDLGRLLRGEPLVEPAPRVQPAPELGYAGIPRRQDPPVPAQRADLLARTDDASDGRLLGVRLADGRRCLLLATSEATPPSRCAAQTGTVAAFSDGSTWAGTTPDRVRTVRVVVDGEPVAVVPTFGSGSAYGQRRTFLVRLPSGSQPSFVALDGLGREVA